MQSISSKTEIKSVYVFTGADPDRPLRFYDVKAHPIPIITPGTLYVSFKGNISRDLPRTIAIELGLVKYFVGIPFPLPCFDNRLGSW
jgi:hypothetical protein